MILKYFDCSKITDKDYNFILEDMTTFGKVVEIPGKKTYSIQRQMKLPIQNLSNLSKLEQCMFMKQFLLSLSNIENYDQNISKYENRLINGIEFKLGIDYLGKISFLDVENINNKLDPNFLYIDNGFHMSINSDGNNLLLRYSSPEYKTIDNHNMKNKEEGISIELTLALKKFDWVMKNSKTHKQFSLNLSKLFDKINCIIPFIDISNTFDTDYRAKLIKEKKKNSVYYKRRIEGIKRDLLDYL